MFGKGGYMDGPGGNVTPVTINGTVWLQGDGCKANTCGWDFIVTLYNPKTHEVVGYRYFGLDDPAYLVWFGEIGVHEFAYLVKNYVNGSVKVTRTDLHRCYSPISFTVIRNFLRGLSPRN